MTAPESITELLEARELLVITDVPDVEPTLTRWLSAVSVHFASTVREAASMYDSSVAVVVVSDTVLDDDLETFRRVVLSRQPACQFVVLESDPLGTDRADDFDVILQTPVSKDAFLDAVEARLVYATYWELFHEFYLLNARATSISRAADEDGEGVSDAMLEQLARLRELLGGFQDRLPHDDLYEIFQNVEARKDYLKQPTKEPAEAAASKYYPGACPDCGLAWGDDHGNELGTGFDYLGAGVRKCRRCGAIIHKHHASNPRVASR